MVRLLGPGEEGVLRAVRLRALRSDPTAFGSTLAREEGLGPADWTRRLGPPAATFVVAPDPTGPAAGMAWAVPDADDPALVHLSGMWVAPEARRSGEGRALVDAVVAWATERGAARLELTVVEGILAAERLYRGAGFAPTGAVEPRPRDALVEAQMVLAL